MRYSLLAPLAALLAFAPGADAAVKVKPAYTVTAAAVSGKNVKFTLSVAIPTTAKCSGKVTASHKLSKKKTAKWSGKLKPNALGCLAAIKGSLPKASYAKKTKFAFSYPGSKSIKKFGASKSLVLSPPAASSPAQPGGSTPGGTIPATYGPQHPGPWFMFFHNDPDSGFSFTIKDDRTVPTFNHPSSLSVPCGPGDTQQVPFNWANTFFSMGAQVGTVGSSDSGTYNHLTYSVNWQFADAHTGTGHFQASGTVESPAGTYHTCSLSIDVDFSGGS